MRKLNGIIGVAVVALVASATAQADETEPPETSDITILFALDVAEVDHDSNPEIEGVLTWMEADPDRRIIIASHPQSVDEDEHLARQRAQALRAYLVARGIAEDRVEIAPFRDSISAQQRADESRFVLFHATRPAPTARSADPPVTVVVMTPEPEPEPEPIETTPYPQALPERRRTPIGVGLSVGGGVTGFIDPDLRDFTSTGGAWEARLTFGTRRTVALEAAYIGTAQEIDALGLDRDAILVSNGIEGALRLNVLTLGVVQPYAVAGIGWSHFDIARSQSNTSSISEDEDVMYVPIGLGLAFHAAGMLVDVRATVRTAFNDDLIAGTTTPIDEQPDVGMDSWNLNAKLGWEF